MIKLLPPVALALLVASACSSPSAVDSQEADATEETCSAARATELRTALDQRYQALLAAGCSDSADTAGCSGPRAQFAQAASDLYACLSLQQFQPTCETVERLSDSLARERQQRCNPATPERQAECSWLAFFQSHTQARVAEQCHPWPAEGACSGAQRQARLAEEATNLATMIDNGCMPDHFDGEACAAAYQAWVALKEANAACNAFRNDETLCSYFTRKKAKADRGIADYCAAPSTQPAPAPFPSWGSYCDHLRLHSSYYAERITGEC